MDPARVWSILLVVLFLFSACTAQVPLSDTAFATAVPIPMNQGLQLEVIEVEYPFGERPVVTLLLENQSENAVSFLSPNYGAQLFMWSESTGEWEEIDDRMTDAAPAEDVLIPREQGDNWVVPLFVSPDVPDNEYPVTLRIVVSGRVYRDGAPIEEEVGAYVDVELTGN